MDGEVSHKGKVISAEGGTVKVEIISQSACSACHAAGFCSASDSKKKEVFVQSSAAFAPGEEVNVMLRRSMGMRAVVLAYAVPLFVVLGITVALCYCGVSELVAGLAGIAAIALWYLLVYLLRDKIAGGYAFTIEKIIN
ncbi:MAG: SoxR reducing system RseC family protein [Bacteroidales bacterium]|nr:SoxR reducing system RseC family protein [Bacteroidales bacterium]